MPRLGNRAPAPPRQVQQFFADLSPAPVDYAPATEATKTYEATLREIAERILTAKADKSAAQKVIDANTAEFINRADEAQEHGHTGTALVTPGTKPRYAYVRVDRSLVVEVAELRSNLYEYFHMRQGEDEDLAVIHATDLIDQVVKEPSIDVAKFRKLAETGVLPWEVVEHTARREPKAAYIGFQVPRE